MNKTLAALFLFLFLPVPSAAEALDAPGSGRELLAFFHGDGGGKKSVLKAKERSLAREQLGRLEGKASLVLFTAEKECKTCEEAERFVEEMAALVPNVSCEILSLAADDGRAAELGIDKVPGMAILGAADSGIRYYGLPLGYEFEEFAKAVRQAMQGRSGVAPDTRRALAQLTRQVTLTVFIVDT
jgi:hypothetical protein